MRRAPWEMYLMSVRLKTIAVLSATLISNLSYSETIEDKEEYVVTASLSPTKLKEIGSSVSIITSEEIKNRNIKQVSELLREIPGFSVNRQGPVGTTTQIRVRGAEGNHLLVLIDGVEANDLTGGSEFNFAHLSTDNIQRIEILRGAQSALWGSDALAGVVNIITKRGSGAPTINAFMEAGSFGTIHGGGNISAGGELYDISVGATHLDTRGSNIAASGDEDDGYTNDTFSFKAGFYPTDFLNLSFVARHSDSDSEIDNFNTDSLLVDDDRISKAKQTYARAEAKVDLFNGIWTHVAGTSITETDRDTFVNGIENNSNRAKKIKLDYKTSLNFDTSILTNAKHTLSLGLDNEKEFFKQSGSVSIFGDPNLDRNTRTTGFIGEYRLGLAKKLFFSGSIRHDDNTTFPDATTHRVTAALLPLKVVRFHASYGTGIKNPTFVERFGSSIGGFFPFIGNPNLKPESSKGWDAGIDLNFNDGQYSIDFTYFKERLEDEINGFVFINGFTATTAQNVNGKSKREGIEISASAQLTQSTRLKGSFTSLDATQPNSVGVQVQEIRRPKNIASLNLNQKLINDRVNLNLGMNYNGSQIDTDFASFTNLRLRSYTLVNFATTFNINKNIQLYGRIENLLDEKYVQAIGFESQGIGGFAGINLTLNP